MKMNVDIELLGKRLVVEVDYEPPCLGRFSGAWEDSYPDIPEYLHVISVKHDDRDITWLILNEESMLLDRIYDLASDACKELAERDVDDFRESHCA